MSWVGVGLIVVKFAAIFAAGVFGCLGLFFDFWHSAGNEGAALALRAPARRTRWRRVAPWVRHRVRREKPRKLTRWGKIAVLGIFGSTLLATIAQTLEVVKGRNDANNAAATAIAAAEQSKNILTGVQKTAKSSEKTLESMDKTLKDTVRILASVQQTGTASRAILGSVQDTTTASRAILGSVERTANGIEEVLYQEQRSLHPISLTDVLVTVKLSFSITDEAFSGYRERLDQNCNELARELDNAKPQAGSFTSILKNSKEGIISARRWRNGTEEYDFRDAPAIWPDKKNDKEIAASALLSLAGVAVSFRNPHYEDSKIQLRMEYFGERSDAPMTEALHYTRNKGIGTITVSRNQKFGGRPTVPEEFRSWVDFKDSEVVVQVNKPNGVLKKAPSILLEQLLLTFGREYPQLIGVKEAEKNSTSATTIVFNSVLAANKRGKFGRLPIL